MTAFAHKIRDFFTFWRKPKKPVIEYAIPQPPSEAAPAAPEEVRVEHVEEKKKEDPKEVMKKLPWSLRLLRLSSKQRLFFYDQMGTLIGAGVPLLDALNLIRAQSKQKSIKKLYTEMTHHVNAGLSLSDTMNLFPHIFPSMQVALMEAGEKSGNLKVVLEELVDEMEDQQDFLRKVTGAMFYPLILIFLSISLVMGMMMFVIPRVATMYAQAKVELPAITQVVIDISHFVEAQWMWLLLGTFGGIILLWLLFTRVRFGRLGWEKFVSVFPLFGSIAKEKNLMIIASNIGMLLKSGVLISEAFEITEKTVGNLHYKRALSEIRHGIIMGGSISELMGLKDLDKKGFKENKFFPLQFSQLIHIGETTGTISEMLFKIRSNTHKSIQYKLKNISSVIEPLMIMVVAMLVGSILLAVMLPFFYIGTTIS